ncbi:hypothetical protein J1G42_07165 [Cellulomonas sp. zg-ZUI222]|uniref:Lipoprotein n=1 Tax=Cellulomonas wangleii TaxID=2816956 RepID=A0ABX8D1N1_9CELL|nr:hypothetical protein [Cellulomonas wangleii]MBO0920603.1 hypothetical protein [Cellulomonas wangleii]MBO0922979.1 hypothetical protein [Cellulomonas wangleii]QVI61369.1 hypothetical protein KG103_12875 [Cellulomonas wangleii]
MRACRTLVVAAATAVLVAGCTGGDADGDPTPSASAAATAAADMSVEDFAASVLVDEDVTDAEAGGDEPLATLTVPVVASASEPYDVEVTVVSLTASERGTDLTFAMRTADGSDGPRSEHYSWGTSTASDLRSLELRPDEESSIKPYTIMDKPDIELDALCACGAFPKIVGGTAQVRSALFPPVPAGASQVVLVFPGADPVTVPVTWE